MAPPRKDHARVGGASALLGTFGLALAIARPPWLDGALLGTPAWALLLPAGAVLAIAGVSIVILSLRPASEEPDLVPAHIAFHSRMSVPAVLPPLPSPRPAGADAGARPTRKLPAPAPRTQQRVPPGRKEISDIEVQVRELTRRINKAGVMLAMGQVSREGYIAYVDDLKRQRANLEAARVRAEMRS